MPREDPNRSDSQESLRQVTELLHKHELVESLVRRQEGPRNDVVETMVHRAHLVELQRVLQPLHPADIARILESLPLKQRLVVWDLVQADDEGEILLEVTDAVRETLIAHMNERELVAATEQLDTDR